MVRLGQGNEEKDLVHLHSRVGLLGRKCGM